MFIQESWQGSLCWLIFFFKWIKKGGKKSLYENEDTDFSQEQGFPRALNNLIVIYIWINKCPGRRKTEGYKEYKTWKGKIIFEICCIFICLSAFLSLSSSSTAFFFILFLFLHFSSPSIVSFLPFQIFLSFPFLLLFLFIILDLFLCLSFLFLILFFPPVLYIFLLFLWSPLY